MKTDIYLGSNLIRNCDATLVVNGVEVFRLRERTGDGRLVVDFDVRGKDGKRIAKIAKNNVVFAAEGFESINKAKESFVRNVRTGEVLAKAEELSGTSVRITGDFWIEGYHVSISPDALTIGGITLSGSVVDGCGKGIVLSPDNIGIGSA